MNYKLSPSDLTFLYDSCKHCFVLKVKHGIAQPSIPLPAVFSKIAALLKDHYTGKGTHEVHPALAAGVVKYGEQRVQSEPIRVPGHDAACFINGRFDIVTDFADGSYGVIDFKTGNPKEEYAELYGRQLHAYAYARHKHGFVTSILAGAGIVVAGLFVRYLVVAAAIPLTL